MQFVSYDTDRETLGKIFRAIDADWRRAVTGRIDSIVKEMCNGRFNEHTVRAATDISGEIATELDCAHTLTTCTLSEELLLTINIPIGYDKNKNTDFYQIRVHPLPGMFVRIIMFHPHNPKSCAAAEFFGPIAADLVYARGLKATQVTLDGEVVSVGAWNAMCAFMVAQGQDGSVGILKDMARDGEI